MEFKDSGIIISIKKYGESAGLLEAITKNHGRHMGLVRGYQSKNNNLPSLKIWSEYKDKEQKCDLPIDDNDATDCARPQSRQVNEGGE